MKPVKCACGSDRPLHIHKGGVTCPHCLTAICLFFLQADPVIAWNAAQRALKAEQKRIKVKGAKKHGSK